MEGALYIVPTPIGNLGDMTPRALDVLATVDLIAAEDTRHSQKLLRHYDIDKPLFAYHEHAGEGATTHLVERIAGGASIALISDAGTPLVSDPGYRLVRAVQDIGASVIPLPGPCAAIAALSASGLPSDRFQFEGFLPAKSGARKSRLEVLANSAATLIFYEAPHRIAATLAEAVEVLGPEREAAVARELTKAYETVRRGPLGELAAWVAADPNQQRGELVWMVAPPARQSDDTQALGEREQRLLERLGELLPPRKAAAVMAEFTGMKTRSLYARLSRDSDET